MLLVPSIYRQIYNQGFAIGWNQAWAENIAQAHQDTQAWTARQNQAQQAGTPFAEPPPKNIYMTRPDFRPPPPPWQEPELPHWIFWSTAGIMALAAAGAAALLFFWA